MFLKLDLSKKCFLAALISLSGFVAKAQEDDQQETATEMQPPEAAPQEESGTEAVAPPESASPEVQQGGDAPAATAVPDTVTPQPSVSPESSSGIDSTTRPPKKSPIRRGSPPVEKDNVFGRYKVRIGVGKPKFDDGMKCFHELYGNERMYPTFGLDVFAFDWYVTIGASLRFNYYSQRGNAAKSKNGTPKGDDCSILEIDDNEQTQLTVLPFQGLGIIQFTPFPKKWLVFDVWGGLGYTYFQETRIGTAEEKSTTTTTTNSSSSDSDSTLTNKGSTKEIVFGGSANILINSFDERSVSSLHETMGLGAIYIAPFLEVTRTMAKSGVSFGRSTIGLVFTFESAR